MKYIKLYEEYYTEDYDIVIYPGSTFLRVDSVLKHKLLSVINGTEHSFDIKKGDYGNRNLKIYKQGENLIFETPEGAKPSMPIEDILLSFD